MQESNVLVKNLEVNYKIIGEGKPMLILHGWGSSSDRWVKVSEILAQSGLQVIIPDLPGFGKSQEPAIAWNLDNYAEWVREFSQKIPELKNEFILLGHSFGGAVATKFTIKYNQKVKKLFLIASACVRKYTVIRKIWYRLAKIIKVLSFLPGYDLFRQAVYKFVLRKSDYPNVSGAMKEIYLNVISEDLSYKINFLKTPTILIWGDRDESTPLVQGRFIQSRIPHSVLCIIPGATHSLHIKTPEALAEKILEHLPKPAYQEGLLSLKNII